jgi:hypothetical protein
MGLKKQFICGLIGIDSYLLPRERKQEITSVVDDLKRKYDPCPASEESLLAIARGEDIKVYYSDLACFAPINDMSTREIILPNIKITSNLAHELGHIILESLAESDAEYFMSELTEKNIFINNLTVMFKQPPYSLSIFRKYSAQSDFLKRDVDALLVAGAGYEIVKELANDFLNLKMQPNNIEEK